MIKSVLLVIIVFVNVNFYSQVFNKPVPPNLHQYEFLKNGNQEGYYLSTPFYLPNGNSDTNQLNSKLYVLNNDGYIIWYYEKPFVGVNFDFKLSSNHLIFASNNTNDINDNIILDNSLNPLDTFKIVNAKADAHEFLYNSDKSYIISARKDSIMDLSPYLFNGVQGDDSANVIGYLIQEFDSNKNLIFKWNSNDYIHPTEMVDGFPNSENPLAFDYAHGNSIDKDSLGNYYVSLRHTNSVLKLDSNGNIKWRLGGKLSDFTFANDSGFSGQHDARILPNGNISVFDNTNTSTIKNSRGVEYFLDTNTWIATKVKEYTYTDSIYANAMGNFQTCNNGDKILNFGLIFRPAPSFIHMDSNANILAEIRYEDRVMSYRSFYCDSLNILPQLEDVICSDTIGGKYLTAPAGKNNYMWNTGANSQNLFVSQSGEYQVWYSYGMGMIGSNPIYIDVNSSCNTVTSINKNELPQNDYVTDIYNVLGKKIEKAIPNQVNIFVYKSGRIKKVLFTQ